MPRKKANKSQLIRDYHEKHPEARHVEIVEALRAHKVSPQLVANVLNRAKGGKKGKPGRKSASKSEGLTLESLLSAKKLVQELGSIETAKAILVALEKLA
jgi:orotate phosphoribosyltransferase